MTLHTRFPFGPTGLSAMALCVAMAWPLEAQFLGRSADDVVEVTLMEGYRLENGRHMAAIRIDLAPGWKTYWRAPGEGGVPTVLHLEGGSGVTGVAIQWPRPEVFWSNGMRSIGYAGDVILPVEFAIDRDGAVQVSGRVEMGVCLDVCMPITLDLDGLLPASTAHVPEIGTALANRPLTAAEAGAGPATCRIEPISDGVRVHLNAQVASVGADETVVIEHADPTLWVSEAMTTRDGGALRASADIVPPTAGPFALSRSDLRITVIGTRMAVELDGCTG